MLQQRTGVAGLGRRQAHLAPRPSVRTRSVRVQAFSVGGGSSTDASSLVSLASLVGTGLAIAVGAVIVRQEAEAQERLARESSNRRPCPTCNGRGYEPCACTRWSDSDVGCNSCRQTGYMQCRSCGGGGTAVPIKVAIRADDGQRRQ